MKIRKNGKTINLSESDMKRIVKKLLSEQVANTKNDLLDCCKEAGIDGSKLKGCVAMNAEECIKEVGELLLNDPFGMATKVANALACLNEKGKSPVMN